MIGEHQIYGFLLDWGGSNHSGCFGPVNPPDLLQPVSNLFYLIVNVPKNPLGWPSFGNALVFFYIPRLWTNEGEDQQRPPSKMVCGGPHNRNANEAANSTYEAKHGSSSRGSWQGFLALQRPCTSAGARVNTMIEWGNSQVGPNEARQNGSWASNWTLRANQHHWFWKPA